MSPDADQARRALMQHGCVRVERPSRDDWRFYGTGRRTFSPRRMLGVVSSDDLAALEAAGLLGVDLRDVG